MSSENLFSSQNNDYLDNALFHGYFYLGQLFHDNSYSCDIFDKYHHHAVELSETSQDSYCSLYTVLFRKGYVWLIGIETKC